MKNLFKTTALSLIALTLAGCHSTSNENVQKITIGISPDYAPYASLTKQGELVGFEPDMVQMIEDNLNEKSEIEYDLEFIPMDFDNIITQIQGNQLDLGISAFTYEEKRQVEWSVPYLGTSQVAVLPKDSTIQSIQNLEGKTLAVQSGSTGEKAAKEIKHAKVAGLKNVQDIMNGLAAHQFDAAIVDLGVAKNYVANGAFKMLEPSLIDEQNYAIAKKGNHEMIAFINESIEQFVASDDYQMLCHKYGLTPLETKE